jgi:hypothetical protein
VSAAQRLENRRTISRVAKQGCIVCTDEKGSITVWSRRMGDLTYFKEISQRMDVAVERYV